MTTTLAMPFLVGLIAVALAFDFLNGMNDAANSIATIVSTRVLRPQYAVAWASFFNFVAFLFFGLHVAETVGRGIVEADAHAGIPADDHAMTVSHQLAHAIGCCGNAMLSILDLARNADPHRQRANAPSTTVARPSARLTATSGRTRAIAAPAAGQSAPATAVRIAR